MRISWLDPPGKRDVRHWGAVKGKELRDLVQLETCGHALAGPHEGFVMFSSPPESKRALLKSACTGCKNTVLQLLFSLEV